MSNGGGTDGSVEPLVTIARAVKPKGLKGEIVADLLTDFPDRFDDIGQLFAVSPEGERKAIQLEGYWLQANRVVLKVAGYDTVAAADSLRGFEFAVPESERVELAEDEFYDWELEGCQVETVAGQVVGSVKSIMRTGSVDLLVVGAEGAKDSLIPMVSSILVKVDKTSGTIAIDPPEGLLDL